MELNPQTSFIPKKPLTGTTNVRRNGLSFVSLLGFIVFLASIAFAGGTIVYKAAIANDIEVQKQNLEKRKGAFDTNFIADIVRFNTKIETAKQLLQKHVAITPVFNFIQANTVSTITFKDLSFIPAQDGSILISMTGVARDYDSIAQQSDEFGKSNLLRDVIFSDLNPDTIGGYRFVFRAKVDPKMISYESALLQSNATRSPVQNNVRQRTGN